MEPDEKAVLGLVKKRLEAGQREYGPLDLASDKREWTEEALEEVLDLAVYMAIAILRLNRTGYPKPAPPPTEPEDAAELPHAPVIRWKCEICKSHYLREDDITHCSECHKDGGFHRR